jgi:predicted membrane GTPase involved in stress response
VVEQGGDPLDARTEPVRIWIEQAGFAFKHSEIVGEHSRKNDLDVNVTREKNWPTCAPRPATS